MIRVTTAFVLFIGCCSAVSAQTKLPTVDEALERSAKTGRPVFAMAGQET